MASLRLVITPRLIDTNGNGLGDQGETVEYAYTVTNDGNVGLTYVVIDDPMFGGLVCTVGDLTVGESATCGPLTYTITAEDVTAGRLLNQATTRGVDVRAGRKNPPTWTGRSCRSPANPSRRSAW